MKPWHHFSTLCVGALILASAVSAHAAPSPYIEDMTWPELQAKVAAGSTTVLIPIGGTEQNGPHMVLGKHNVRARVLAGQIALALGRTVVAPARSFKQHGFRDVIFLGDHGDYQKS